MRRAVYIAGALVPVVVLGLLALSFFNNPIKARKSVLEERLASIDAARATYERPSLINYPALERAILAKPHLWQPLISKPEKQEPPPNLEELLSNVALTRYRMGSGDNVQVKILVFGQGGERTYWIREGDLVNGLTVKEIGRDSVVFSLMHNGKEYVAELRP